MGQEEIAKSFDLALKYLSYRSRTEKEMVEYLEKKGKSPQTIAAVMEKLVFYHYINDEDYLESAIRTNLMGNQFGRLRLKQDLARRGIRGELLNQLQVFYPIESEEECCRSQMQKAIKKYAGEFGRKKLQKVGAYLQRRGFSYDMINTMIGDVPLETAMDMPEKRQSDIEGYFEKYRRMQERKGYSGWELNQRIKRNLASRGVSFDEINAVMNREDESN